MIPDAFIQDLLARIDIVDLVDSYVPLKKAGANYAACCPFHNEKSPSFTVSPAKQFYHCFGCGAHGTAIGFVMEYQGLGFVDAVKELADRAGMTVPDDGGRGLRDEKPGQTRTLIEIMARAAQYYKEQLKASPRAIAYCRQRGLSGEIAARFGIGYAPEGWQNLQAVFADYSATELETAGLVKVGDEGRRYDRFRDRLMIPIINPKGDIIAFGGRIIDQGEPKYLNSPETPLFEKGRELFGLPQARQALRETNTAIVTEGYMDVIALTQNGVGNAVATLGTATTATHVGKLLRQVDRIVF
ncbi:MAG: DNA primase, partial [Desulfobulbus sp.]|nr:DNA primase [Desulfobulbus sp.]